MGKSSQFGLEIIKPENSNWEDYYQAGKNWVNQILIKHNNLSSQEILKFCKMGKETIARGLTYD